MPRRLVLLLAAFASLAIVACNSAPAAPALTDPKEILTKTVTSLTNVKTIHLTGTFGGSVAAGSMGNFDLSSVKLDASADVAGKKVRLNLDAPTLLGTAVDVIAVDNSAYLKIVGPLAAMAGANASGKYTKMDAGSGDVPQEATDPAKAIAELEQELAKLPKPPQKLADEKCGDTDCYHVQLALSADELAAVSGGSADAAGSVTLDVLTRKNDLRPARIAFTFDGGTSGTVTGTFELTYDQAVNISAPPADQIAGG